MVFHAEADAFAGLGIDEFKVSLCGQCDFHRVQQLQGKNVVALLTQQSHCVDGGVFFVKKIGDDEDDSPARQELADLVERSGNITTALRGAAGQLRPDFLHL